MNYWNEENIDISMNQIYKVRENKQAVICVVGDTILDEYLFGLIREGNPKIFQQQRQELYPGGAANVAMNVNGLGGNCAFFSITGCCDKAKRIHNILDVNKVNTQGIISSKSMQTCCITRFISDGKVILRYDNKYVNSNAREAQGSLYFNLKEKSKDYSIVVISDYQKGCITNEMFSEIKKLCITNNIRLLVDCKGRYDLQNVYLLKVNRKEFCTILGKRKYADYELEKESIIFKVANKIKYFIITMDKKGLLFIDDKNISRWIPSFCGKMVDACGAGDTLIAALAVCLANNIDILHSVLFANLAAGASCEKFGTSPITKQEMKIHWSKMHE